jgi:hypothetical protein
MTGSTEWVDGRNGNQPRFNTIEGNLIHHLGLYTKQSCAIFSGVSCQNKITHNILFHGPRALLNMNDGFGGDTMMDHNLFFRSLLETSDHGPYNSWDRLPFLTTVRNGTAMIELAWNHIVSNFFFSGSANAIDTDDGSDMVNASSNVIYKQPLWKTDFGGHTKSYSNNVEIMGGGCGANTDDPTNAFFGNKCIGEGTHSKCTDTSKAVYMDNSYYTSYGDGSEVCPGSSLPMEQGSKTLPFPDIDGVLQLAKDALGMEQ